jgi:hypothetical protein
MRNILSRKDVDELQRQIPNRDVVAEKQNKKTTHGTNVSRIEEVENAMIPWLRARRSARRPSA